MLDYTTMQGDTWDFISLKVYGTELQMSLLVEANATHREIVSFGSGIVLKVPDLPEELNENLPPWKR